jgi:bacterioferritin-associated ferredoxin
MVDFFCPVPGAEVSIVPFGNPSMIVCSCNVLSDQDVRTAVTAEGRPRSTGQVYGCLGCSAQCGRCARTIRKIMDEALDSAAASACNGCPRHPAP